MTPPDNNSEPSIEEILDSIRQIISDEDASDSEATPGRPIEPDDVIELTERYDETPPVEKPAVEKPYVPPVAVSRIDEKLPPPAPAETVQIDMTDSDPEPAPKPAVVQRPLPRPPEPVSAPATTPQPAPQQGARDEPGLTPPPRQTPPPVQSPEREMPDDLENIVSRHAEAAAMRAFSELNHRAAIEKGGGVTIEDVVRYEIRPLLRAWIDKHLPPLVERLLQRELERIARRFEDD